MSKTNYMLVIIGFILIAVGQKYPHLTFAHPGGRAYLQTDKHTVWNGQSFGRDTESTFVGTNDGIGGLGDGNKYEESRSYGTGGSGGTVIIHEP